MRKILVVDNSTGDARRFADLMAGEGLATVIGESGAEGRRALEGKPDGFAAAFILWDLPGPISGFDLLIKCKQLWPDVPVVVMSAVIDASMATRASVLGARDFLEKPLDSLRILSCVRRLLADKETPPLVRKLRERIIGDSPVLLDTLNQVAKTIPHASLSVLLTGESGTGKELFARAIHDFSPRGGGHWVAVNISAIPATLVESTLFGHEKGAFTDAKERRIGVFEEANGGSIFLDEIGDLELSLQSKLLRVIQEQQFRRLGGKHDISFDVRLICATNRNLAEAVSQGTFRRDLFHRIAEVSIQLPPLRERRGDLDLLLRGFLDSSRGTRNISFARETLMILRSYPFFGNVRELKNLVKAAVIECDGDIVLPHHLPLQNMGSLLQANGAAFGVEEATGSHSDSADDFALKPLILELGRFMSADWMDLPYREVRSQCLRALDRIYLENRLNQAKHNVSQAARDAGIDVKTFRSRWKDCGLPALEHDREGVDDEQNAQDIDRRPEPKAF